MKRVAERHERARVSGWLMFDVEHPKTATVRRDRVADGARLLQSTYAKQLAGFGVATSRVAVLAGRNPRQRRQLPPAERRP